MQPVFEMTFKLLSLMNGYNSFVHPRSGHGSERHDGHQFSPALVHYMKKVLSSTLYFVTC